jgi:hypothetical protein
MTPPYSWDVSSIQNGPRYQVRITVSDKDVYPSMKGTDKTGNFTIAIPGNDDLGPKVIPQSIEVEINPKIVTSTDTILPFIAAVSDSFTGGSEIGAAEWSLGTNPYPAGTGDAMHALDGVFDEMQEGVNDTIYFAHLPGSGTRICTLWVRGQDNATFEAQNWGPGLMRTFTLIDGIPLIGVSEFDQRIPLYFSLSAPLPNPFTNKVLIQYGVPRRKRISLKIYNCLGQLVKTMFEEKVEPGFYKVIWDGKDNLNRKLSAGIYFIRFTSDEYTATKKAVLIK